MSKPDAVRAALAKLVRAVEWSERKEPHNLTTLGRALRAARAALAEQPAEPVAYGYPNSAITGSNRWMMLRERIPEDDQYGGAMWIPLYAAPHPAPSVAVPETLQLWCDTCEGTGKVHMEHQIGVAGSGGEFDCPDCDGKGYITTRRYVLAASPQPPTQQKLEVVHAGVIAMTRESCAALCEEEARRREEAAHKNHGAGSPAYGRQMAGVNAALNCAKAIRSSGRQPTRQGDLRAAAGLAFYALCEEAAAYDDRIDHVVKAMEALRPFFPYGVDHAGRDKQPPTEQSRNVMLNGMTEDETAGTASVAGLMSGERTSVDEFVRLLDEVRQQFTRDDHLPDGLLLRIDEAIRRA